MLMRLLARSASKPLLRLFVVIGMAKAHGPMDFLYACLSVATLTPRHDLYRLVCGSVA